MGDDRHSDLGGAMTEAEARTLLRQCDSVGRLEAWIADQPWVAAPGGWKVLLDLERWRFSLEPGTDGLRISAGMPGALPTVWTISAGP
jgi:hypothetical protein